MSIVELDEDPFGVVAIGTSQYVGAFSVRFPDERWEWSDEVAAMHGYDPGQVQPSTELMLSHKHPEDRERVAAEIVDAVRTGKPFSSRHRIVDTRGGEHHVVVAGEPALDDDDRVIGTTGFFIDITESRRDDIRGAVDDVVDELVRSRGSIEQAKGMLMLVYGIGPERAFDLMRWRSQQTNTKLNRLAAQLVTDLAGTDVGAALQQKADHVLLTTHRRIRAD